MRRLYIIIFICFCLSTEGQNEREKFAPEEITVETTNIDNAEEETPSTEINQDVKNNKEQQDNQEDKSKENLFHYKNQDMHIPHTYKPFCIFKKYMEINNSFCFSQKGIFQRNGFVALLIHNFLYNGVGNTFYQLCWLSMGYGLLFMLPYIPIIQSSGTLIQFFAALAFFCLLDGGPFFWGTINSFREKKEYIFFSYKSIKFLYQINYNFGIEIFPRNITRGFCNLPLTTENIEKLQNQKCPICLCDFIDQDYFENHRHYPPIYGHDRPQRCFFHKECIGAWLQEKKTCPTCRKGNMCLDEDPPYELSYFKFIPKLFVEFSSNTTHKYSVIFRILVCGAGINLFINKEKLRGDASDLMYLIPTVQCGGEIGMAFTKTLEVLIFFHPQWLFNTNKILDIVYIDNFGINVGISIRLLV